MYDEITQTVEQKSTRKPTPLAGSLLYLIVLVLMIVSSLFTVRLNTEGDRYYSFMFIVQLATIGLPTILYLLLFKKDVKYSLRLNKASVAEVFLSVGMAFFGYGIIAFINFLWVLFLSKFGTPDTTSIPDITNSKHFLMALIVIAVEPAILEEFLFRGVIQRGNERFGKIAHIILTGILFALLHLSVVSVPSIILMGILLCYIAYRSDSIWPGVAFHFTNNAIAVTLTYISSVVSSLFPGEVDGMATSLADLPAEEIRMAITVWSVIGFFALLFFGACLAGFHLVTRDKKRELLSDNTAVNAGGKFSQLLPAVIAVVIIILLLILEIINMVNPIV